MISGALTSRTAYSASVEGQMQFSGQTIVYSEEEVEEFHPVWMLLAEEDGFEREALRLRDLLLLADEEALCNGTSPIRPDLERFSQALHQNIAPLKLDWTAEKLRAFEFYCFHHNGRDSEYNFNHEARQALVRKNRAWREEFERSRGKPGSGT